jgi:hypothetical protein
MPLDAQYLLGPAIAVQATSKCSTRLARRALTEREATFPPASGPYALRHAGGPHGSTPRYRTEWAKHSVNVLLRVYAKCVVGQDSTTRRLISEALKSPQDAG